MGVIIDDSISSYEIESFKRVCLDSQNGILPNVWAGYKHPDMAEEEISNYLDTLKDMDRGVSYDELREVSKEFDNSFEGGSKYISDAVTGVQINKIFENLVNEARENNYSKEEIKEEIEDRTAIIGDSFGSSFAGRIVKAIKDNKLDEMENTDIREAEKVNDTNRQLGD
mgnify:CR=1 FL=1